MPVTSSTPCRLDVDSASGELRQKPLVCPLHIAFDDCNLDGIAARKPLDEALILVGVAAGGFDELGRYALVLGPERVTESLVEPRFRCRGIVKEHQIDVSGGHISAHLSELIEVVRQRDELRHDDVMSYAQVRSRHLQAETSGGFAGFGLSGPPAAQ